MPKSKLIRIDKRKRFPLADIPGEETVKLITYTRGDPQYHVIEDDGSVVEFGKPLREVLHEAINGVFHKISPNTGKQYSLSIKHLEHADPNTTYVVFRFGFRALPEADGTPVRLTFDEE
jgi:hypothetical protein